MRARRSLIVITLALQAGLAAVAGAQPSEPIGRFVVDARGALARFKGTAEVATPLGVQSDDLPTRGLGLNLGAHLYPLRTGRVTFGIGAEVVAARDSKTGEVTTAVPNPPTVTTRFSALAPQVSLNFGKRDGWSYLSGGIGVARLTSETGAQTFPESAARVRLTHYGGGARWFTGPHLAVTFDVRFYTLNAREAAATRPAYPRTRMMVISVGVSLH